METADLPRFVSVPAMNYDFMVILELVLSHEDAERRHQYRFLPDV